MSSWQTCPACGRRFDEEDDLPFGGCPEGECLACAECCTCEEGSGQIAQAGDSSVVHCWWGLRDEIEKVFGWGSKEWAETYQEAWENETCMLLQGHKGPHNFTPDSEVQITFLPGSDT